MDAHGIVVNDAHAEVLCTRLLRRFIWMEILKASDKEGASSSSSSSSSDVVRWDAQRRGFVLRDGVLFSLYVSRPPCGDASIFDMAVKPASEDDGASHDTKRFRTFGGSTATAASADEGDGNDMKTGSDGTVGRKRKLWMLNRTGAKAVEEKHDAVELGVVRFKSARSDMPKHLTTQSMSCSDKLAKWNMLGCQGALLSLFLADPLRYSSISVGGGWGRSCQEAVERALWRRCVAAGDNETPALAVSISDRVFAHAQSLCSSNHAMSLLWVADDTAGTVELLNGKFGLRQGLAPKTLKKHGGVPRKTSQWSIVCKRSLFALFWRAVKKHPDKPLRLPDGVSLSQSKTTYREAKNAAVDYQRRKQASAFLSKHWVYASTQVAPELGYECFTTTI